MKFSHYYYTEEMLIEFPYMVERFDAAGRLIIRDGGVKAIFPEMLIARKLPKSCILWTKDINLLYHGDRRKKRYSKGRIGDE